jgi:GNAT superfamily N-acetyltransferase
VDQHQSTIRPAEAGDIETLIAFRKAMFVDMGEAEAGTLDSNLPAFARWLEPRLASGEVRGWMADVQGRSVGSALAWVYTWYPGPNHPDSCEIGYVFNVFVAEELRRRGLARRLLEPTLAYLRGRRVRKITLHASAKGRGLYEHLGFAQSNEMELLL